MKEEYLKTINLQLERLLVQNDALKDIGRALRRVGFNKLYEEIKTPIIVIDQAEKQIRTTISEIVSEELLQAQENSENVLNATLAGIKLAKETDVVICNICGEPMTEEDRVVCQKRGLVHERCDE